MTTRLTIAEHGIKVHTGGPEENIAAVAALHELEAHHMSGRVRAIAVEVELDAELPRIDEVVRLNGDGTSGKY